MATLTPQERALRMLRAGDRPQEAALETGLTVGEVRELARSEALTALAARLIEAEGA